VTSLALFDTPIGRCGIAWADDDTIVGLQLPEARQRRRLALPQIGEDEAQVLLGRIALDLDFGREGGVFGGHLDTLAGAVILPAVVEAPDAVALDPAGRELRAPVRAAEVH